MNVLQLINKFCRITALPETSAVVSATNQQIIQIRELLEEELIDLGSRHSWSALRKIVNFTGVNEQVQNRLSVIANGYEFLIPETFWDVDRNLKVLGPLSAEEWASVTVQDLAGPRTVFRIINNLLHLYPAPENGNRFRFEVATNYPIVDSRGIYPRSTFVSDTDKFLLNENLILLGLRWRWRREKGLDYAELFNMYEFQVKDAIARDGSAPRLSMGASTAYRSGVYIPIGDWMQ